MKTKNLVKRIFFIFSVLLVVMLLVGPLISFSEDVFLFRISLNENPNFISSHGVLYYVPLGSSSPVGHELTREGNYWVGSFSDINFSYPLRIRFYGTVRNSNGQSFSVYASSFSINSTLLPTTESGIPIFSYSSGYLDCYGILSLGSSTVYGYFNINYTSPATPTPTPTPTLEPTPTPAPTFNPYAPTYTTFFERLSNDANSALNALYLGWQQANNKFYTGIFFIGIPVLLGIFGLVASIFFGGGSDD